MDKRRTILLGGAVLLIVAVVGGVWWYLRDDAPAEVTLDSAAAGVTTVPGDQATTLDGTWTVDTATGTFDFSSASGTFAGFRVSEQLSGIGSTTAVGRTGSVSGSMSISDSSVTKASFTVDLTSITTDRDRRDAQVQRALETDRFPDATFVLTEPIPLPGDAADGGDLTLDAVGDLTIHGETHEVTVPLQARLKGSTILVVGSVDLAFSDYGVSVPKAPIVLSVDDHGTMEFQLLLTRS